jgi:hypothetical protein
MLSDWPVKAQDDAQFRHPFHDLRHEAISRFFAMDLTTPEVASISGHRCIRMLMRYAHPMRQRIIGKMYKVEPGVASAAQTWHWRGPFHQLETTMAQKPFKDITNRHLERGNQHIDSFDGSAGVGVDRRHAPP